MFYYKNQKFHKKGIAFAIPDGTYLLEYEKESDELFEIAVTDDLFRITLGFECAEPSEYFNSDDFKDLYTVIEEPKDVSIGSLHGQRAIYEAVAEKCYEYRLATTDKNGVSSTFFVLIRTDKSETDISSVCNHPAVTELFKSLEVSKE